MQFSIARIKNLMLHDGIIYRKSILYGFVALMAFTLFLFWIPTLENNFGGYDTGFWVGWFVSFLFIGGLLLTSVIFWEFRSAAGRIQYLGLPATNMEKLVSRSLYTHVLYPLFLTLVFVTSYQAFKYFQMTEVLAKEFFEALPYIMGAYFSLASFMLIFSIIFNNYVAPKAIIVSVIVYVVSVIIGAGIFRLIMNDLFHGMSLRNNRSMTLDSEALEPVGDVVLTLLKYFLLIVLPSFLWIVAYFKMKEKEV